VRFVAKAPLLSVRSHLELLGKEVHPRPRCARMRRGLAARERYSTGEQSASAIASDIPGVEIHGPSPIQHLLASQAQCAPTAVAVLALNRTPLTYGRLAEQVAASSRAE